MGDVEDKSWEEVEVGSSQVALEKWCVPEQRSGEHSAAQHTTPQHTTATQWSAVRVLEGAASTTGSIGQRARVRNPTEEQAQRSWVGRGSKQMVQEGKKVCQSSPVQCPRLSAGGLVLAKSTPEHTCSVAYRGRVVGHNSATFN